MGQIDQKEIRTQWEGSGENDYGYQYGYDGIRVISSWVLGKPDNQSRSNYAYVP